MHPNRSSPLRKMAFIDKRVANSMVGSHGSAKEMKLTLAIVS